MSAPLQFSFFKVAEDLHLVRKAELRLGNQQRAPVKETFWCAGLHNSVETEELVSSEDTTGS